MIRANFVSKAVSLKGVQSDTTVDRFRQLLRSATDPVSLLRWCILQDESLVESDCDVTSDVTSVLCNYFVSSSASKSLREYVVIMLAVSMAMIVGGPHTKYDSEGSFLYDELLRLTSAFDEDLFSVLEKGEECGIWPSILLLDRNEFCDKRDICKDERAKWLCYLGHAMSRMRDLVSFLPGVTEIHNLLNYLLADNALWGGSLVPAAGTLMSHSEDRSAREIIWGEYDGGIPLTRVKITDYMAGEVPNQNDKNKLVKKQIRQERKGLVSDLRREAALSSKGQALNAVYSQTVAAHNRNRVKRMLDTEVADLRKMNSSSRPVISSKAFAKGRKSSGPKTKKSRVYRA